METIENNKTLELEIWRDESPMNPFTDWDCEPDLMCKGNRYHKDFSDGAIVDYIRDRATHNLIIRHQKKIADILGLNLEYYVDYTTEQKVDEINYEIRDADIDMLCELCELFKIPYKQYTSRGYSQGDWLDVLIVLTDEFFERTGCDRKHSESILEGTAKLFDNWAWGDVYGFSVVEINRCECCSNDDREVVDSCGGFYGSDFEENGMLEYVPDELHEQLKNFDHSDIKS